VVEARQDIVRQGERLHHSTLLLDGFVSRYKLLTEGSRQILSLQIPGDFVDLHSFLLKTMDHGICTLSRCKLVSVPHETLRKTTEHSPRLTRALWWDVAVDGAIFREWMVGIGSRDSQQRIAHLFCELLHRLGAIGRADKQGFALPLTQSDLGEAMGITPVHVNRVLRDLRKANVVQFSKQRVEILDLKRLSQMADFDAGYLHL
jgi:CRP-like cAMP-binding protein